MRESFEKDNKQNIYNIFSVVPLSMSSLFVFPGAVGVRYPVRSPTISVMHTMGNISCYGTADSASTKGEGWKNKKKNNKL